VKKRVVFQATGEVQKVGYRDFVQDAARELGIVGTVENMRDGSVQIVCEGEDAIIGKFQKAIKVKKDFIDVKNVSVIKTGKAAGKFKYFDIKYGSTSEEIGDRMGAGILYMGATRDEVRSVKDEVKASRQDTKAMHADLKGGFKQTNNGLTEVKNEVKSMHGDMNTRFDTLETRYGEIGQDIKTVKIDMAKLTSELHNSTEALILMTQKVGALIDKKLAE